MDQTPLALRLRRQNTLHALGTCDVYDASLLSSLFLRWDMLTESSARHFRFSKSFFLAPRASVFIDHFHSPLRATGIAPGDALTVMIPLASRGDSVYRQNSLGLGDAIVSHGGVIDNRFGAGDRILFVRLDRALLDDAIFHDLAITAKGDSKLLRIDHRDAEIALCLRSLVRLATDPGPDFALDHPKQLRSIEIEVTRLALALLPLGDRLVEQRSGARRRVFYRAIERILHTSSYESICLSKLATQLQVSMRTLEYAFKETVQRTPSGFIRELKLQRLRRELLLGHQSQKVNDAAARCGFIELGRMARDYNSCFGELPSQTLKRRVGIPLAWSEVKLQL